MPGSPAKKLGQGIEQQPGRVARRPITRDQGFGLIQRQQHPGAGGLLQPPQCLIQGLEREPLDRPGAL